MRQGLPGLAVVCLAAAVAACTPTAEEEPAVEEAATTRTDVEVINSVREAWVAAENDSDLDAVIAVFTDDVVFMMADEPTLIGKEAVRSWYFVGPRAEMSSDEVVVSGDWAFDRGTFSTDDESGKYLGILQRQPEGSWRYARVMAIYNPPPEM